MPPAAATDRWALQNGICNKVEDMKSPSRVRLAPMDGYEGGNSEFRMSEAASHRRFVAPLRNAILRTRQWLLSEQHADGYWVGELEGDTILESEYILLLAFLGQEQSIIAEKCARHLLNQQLASGGWAMYPGGDVEISASVKAYFALKLTGHDPATEPMQRARAAILAHGGADSVNSFTRFYLALLGQISYEECPAVPPEFVLLPSWFPVNLYSCSAWSRTILVPLSIISACQPRRQVEAHRGIRELFIKQPSQWPPLRCPGLNRGTGLFSWDGFFQTTNTLLKWLQRNNASMFRKRALKAAEKWMVQRFEGSDGLGAIFPPMIWAVIALRCLGYRDESPELEYCYDRLEGLIIEEDETARLQPCKSPVWDTAIALRALSDSGVEPDHPAVSKSVEWLLSQEVTRKGDWAKTVNAAPGGWCFEHANEFYPDLDDTAMVLMALRGQFAEPIVSDDALPPGLRLLVASQADSRANAKQQVMTLDRIAASSDRAERWMLAMQNKDGGWGAFDRDNDRQFLCYVPFADHNAMIDPSTPDLAARVLESLAQTGHRVGHPAVDRAVAYLRKCQEADGSWFGRWGVNYIYGTWQVIVGLTAVGVPCDDQAVVAGANWLLAYQQASGGWGESPDSYVHPHLKGQGKTTASQTAWAVMGLVAAGKHEHAAVARGIQYLLSHQRADGTWDEAEFTGTGFPRVFYLRYHMYPIYFPLMALSRWAVAIGASLREVETATIRLAEASALIAAVD